MGMGGVHCSRLTTHVLDLARGTPAAGVFVELRRWDGETVTLLRTARTNGDGRLEAPLLDGPDLTAGEYELLFHAGEYFQQVMGVESKSQNPMFLNLIPIRFHVGAEGGHYHVPLLLAPGGYSTYRGS